MAQEDNNNNNNILSTTAAATTATAIAGDTSSGGGSRTVKPKKVPQRGLGVAQLEKIRLEEQRKREALQAANALANTAIGSVTDASSQCLSVCISPSPSASNLPSPKQNPLYRSFSSVPIQINPNQLHGSRGEIGNRLPRLYDYNLDEEKQRVDSLGFVFRSPQVNFKGESNATAVLPLSQRSYQFQRPSSSSSVVNANSRISSQMEPPSNQILRGNSYTSSWSVEDKMVGVKRSYPFSLESQPVLSNFHPSYAASRSRSDELPSSSSGYTAQFEPRTKYMRDSSSTSTPLSERNPSADVIRVDDDDDGRLNGDFLTLGPPKAASPLLNSSDQENLKSQMHQLGPSRSKEEAFSFFPVKSQPDQSTTNLNNGDGEKGEAIDLNLKL